MSNRRIEGVWLAQSFLDDLVLVYPVYAIMMLDAGIGEFDLTLLFVIWSTSALVFEVPSGVLGDLLDRRAYVLMGSVIRASAYLAWWLWPTFPGFALGFVLWALGSVVHSGTLQSLLYDVLAEQGRTPAFARIYGRGRALNNVGILVAMAVGGFVAQTGYTWVLWLSAVAPLLSGAVIFGLLDEPPRTHADPESEAPSFMATLRSAGVALVANRRLRRVSIMYVGLVAMFGTIDEFPGPLLAEQGLLSLGVIGVLYGAFLGALSIGSAMAHRLQTMGVRRIALVSLVSHLVLLAALAAGMWVPWPTGGVLLCGGLGLYFALMGTIEVLLETSLQHEIDVGARATITSVSGAAMEVFGVVNYLIIGVTAAQLSWSAAIAVLGMIALLLSAGFAYVAGPRAARSRS